MVCGYCGAYPGPQAGGENVDAQGQDPCGEQQLHPGLEADADEQHKRSGQEHRKMIPATEAARGVRNGLAARSGLIGASVIAILLGRHGPPRPGRAVPVRAGRSYPALAPCRASCRSFSPSLDSEVFSTVPPNLLIASTALSGVTFSTIKNNADVPGLSIPRT